MLAEISANTFTNVGHDFLLAASSHALQTMNRENGKLKLDLSVSSVSSFAYAVTCAAAFVVFTEAGPRRILTGLPLHLESVRRAKTYIAIFLLSR